MTTSEILTTINIILTAITISVSYSNYTHIKQKDFQDNLYKIKIDVYKKLIEECHDALVQLDINSPPFVQIYETKTKEEWEVHYEAEIAKLQHIGFDIEKTAYLQIIFLPSRVVEKMYEFTTTCIRYVVVASHFDTDLIIQKQDELHELFFDLVDVMRNDLDIDVIDKSLKSRLGEMNRDV